MGGHDDAAIRSVDEHLQAILDDLRPMAAVQQPLLEALDLACAEDVVAPVPPARRLGQHLNSTTIHVRG